MNYRENCIHRISLTSSCSYRIIPVFQSLADADIFVKCLHGLTQNRNESFNDIVWTCIPKTAFVGLNSLSFSDHDSVISFNDGNAGPVKVLKNCFAPGSKYCKWIEGTGESLLDAKRENLKLFLFEHKLYTKRKESRKLLIERRTEIIHLMEEKCFSSMASHSRSAWYFLNSISRKLRFLVQMHRSCFSGLVEDRCVKFWQEFYSLEMQLLFFFSSIILLECKL